MSIQTPIGVLPRRASYRDLPTPGIISNLSPQWVFPCSIPTFYNGWKIPPARGDREKLLCTVKDLLDTCAKFWLKIHAKKNILFKKTVTFCGRRADVDGVGFEPRHLQGLTSMERPAMLAQLQKFICAANWMRDSLPKFAEESAPLQKLLESCYAGAGKRTKRSMRKVPLGELWVEIHDAIFKRFKILLARSVNLVHMKEKHTL